MNQTLRHLVPLVLATAATAQLPAPNLQVFNQSAPGVAVLDWTLSGIPGALPYAMLADAELHPVTFLGERIWVGPSATQFVLEAGTTRGAGAVGQVVVPAVGPVVGRTLWLQALTADANYANGVFGASNPLGVTIHAERVAVQMPVVQPQFFGWTGTFDRNEVFRVQGAAVRRRAHSTVDPQGIPFGQPLPAPFHHYGLREQMVFRPQDVGATGEPELLVGIAWRPLLPPVAETFDVFELAVAHTDVQPDFTIDPFSALPAFPNSGLAPTFARNYRVGSPLVRLFAGRYDVVPAQRRADGYMPYPLAQPFAYDGTSSLLFEYKVAPAPQHGAAQNGHAVRIMVQSHPLPGARLVAKGADAQHVVDPQVVTDGFPDNTMHDMRLEFVRIESVAVSPWIAAVVGANDWQPPAIAAWVPNGGRIAYEYRGAIDTNGRNATAWSPSIDVADGMFAVQMRITFVGNPRTGEVPFVSSIQLPVR